MPLNAKQIAELNNWDLSEPALKKGTLIGSDELKMGDLLNEAISPFKVVQVLKTQTLAASPATVLTPVTNVLSGDLVVAVITFPNTGGSIATALAAIATADEEITITPNATPSTADGKFDVIVFRTAV